MKNTEYPSTPTAEAHANPIHCREPRAHNAPMRPLRRSHSKSTALASRNRKLAAASGGMACATTRPQGQEAPHKAAMPTRHQCVEYRDAFMERYYSLIFIHHQMSKHS